MHPWRLKGNDSEWNFWAPFILVEVFFWDPYRCANKSVQIIFQKKRFVQPRTHAPSPIANEGYILYSKRLPPASTKKSRFAKKYKSTVVLHPEKLRFYERSGRVFGHERLFPLGMMEAHVFFSPTLCSFIFSNLDIIEQWSSIYFQSVLAWWK